MRTMMLTLLSSLLLFSCTKESKNNNTTNYIKAKIDGQDKTFNSMAFATKLNAGSTQMISVHGGAGGNSGEGLVVSVEKEGGVTAGTYTEDDASNSYTVAAEYVPKSNEAWGAGIHANPAHPFTITITEITATRIKGTFSGGVYNENGMGNTEKVITNGEFNVPIQ